MSNISISDTDKLEELPLRAKIGPPDGWRSYWGSDYPYNKIQRFLHSRVGRIWNDVFSEFCHLEWVPKQYKTKEQIGHSVILNTFMRDGVVWYYSHSFHSSSENPIGDYNNPKIRPYQCRDDVFYVHPTTFKLCYEPKHKKDWNKEYAEKQAQSMCVLGNYHQLLKIDGIWHEVKGEPKKTDIIEIDGLHYRKMKAPPKPEDLVPPARYYFGKVVINTKPLECKIVNGEYYVPTVGESPSRYSDKNIGPKDRLIEDDANPSRPYWNRYNYNTIKITLYRQLNRKELKKHGLANDIKTLGEKCKICGGHKPNCTGHYTKLHA